MRNKLWITRWNQRRKNGAIAKQQEGTAFLSSYVMNDFKRVFFELCVGLQMNEGSMTSRYVSIIPPNGNEVIKIRISDHPSSTNEWGEKELTGLPNRRYSIVIFSKKSMPNESKQGVKELNWNSYLAQNIPVYEKTYNRYYLKETFKSLISILSNIYQGGCPEDKTIRINLAENKQYKSNTNMNKKLIRLTESDLHNIVKKSVNKILNEWEYAGWINDIEDPIEYDPNDPESVKEREIEDSWREFRDHISNRREMNDRRRKFYDDLKYYPKRVQTSSTLNGEDSQGVASMSMLGDEPKGGWGKKYNDTKKGFNDRYLSRKAPKQPY